MDNWINVDEYLPSPTNEVLYVLYEDGTEDVARFIEGNFYICYVTNVKNITHWRSRVEKVNQTNKLTKNVEIRADAFNYGYNEQKQDELYKENQKLKEEIQRLKGLVKDWQDGNQKFTESLESQKRYWKQRCEAAEKVITNETNDGYSQQDYEVWQQFQKENNL